MTTEIWLVRHGQTDWNVEGRYQGQSNLPLNDAGRQQARELAEKLRGETFDVIYSSDLARACETAQILSAGLDIPLVLDRRLREIHLGAWEGMLFTEIQHQYPAEVELRSLHQRDYRVPGGETPAEVAVRVSFAARDIAAAFPRGKILLVAHGLSVATLYCLANGISLETVFEYIPANTETLVIHWPPKDGRY